MDEQRKRGLKDRFMQLPNQKVNNDQDTGKDTTPDILLSVESHKQTSSGIKAVVGAHLGNDEIYKAEVKLWETDNRTAYAKKCIRALNGNLSPKDADKTRKRIETQLKGIEQFLKEDEARKKSKLRSTADTGKKDLSEEEKAEARALLQNPALLFMVGQILRFLGLAGETINALILYLVLTSRLLHHIISAVVKAESGAGKSFLDNLVRKLFPPEAYFFMSGMSKQALVYLDEDFRHRMIVIAEAGGIANASYNLRTLLSENKLRYTVTEKDPETGKHKARIVDREGPTGLITTTTWSQLHPENETRLISLSLDESEQQTHRVKKSIASQYEEVDKEEPNLDAWMNAQRLLKPVQVRIPYARYLAERTPNKPLRIRRDFGKLLYFVAVSANFHQHQRKQINAGVIEANLADYFYTKILLEEVFFQSLYGIHPNTQKLMEAIQELCQKKNEKPMTDLQKQLANVPEEPVDDDDQDSNSPIITTRELMDHLGWNKGKVIRWAKPLKDYDWVIEGGRGKPDHYKLGIDPRESNSKLPSVEELAGQFPELARGFQAVHPLTGEVLHLCNDVPAQDSNQVMEGNVSKQCNTIPLIY